MSFAHAVLGGWAFQLIQPSPALTDPEADLGDRVEEIVGDVYDPCTEFE
jgi:hypothetical protein